MSTETQPVMFVNIYSIYEDLDAREAVLSERLNDPAKAAWAEKRLSELRVIRELIQKRFK